MEFMVKKLGWDTYQKLILRSQRQLSDAKIDEKLVRQGLKIEWQRMQAIKKEGIIGSR